MESQGKSGFRQTLSVLGPGPFRRYMIGEVISMTGTWMQVMAQSWVMTTLTHSAFMMGMVSFAAGIPQLLLSMTGGTFADRYDKRTILVLTQIVQIGSAVTLGTLVLTGKIQLWHILAMACLVGISGAFEMPAASALVPELVAPEEIASAMAVDRSLFHATRLVGPASAGFLIGQFGTASAFYANAASFLALIGALMTLKPRPQGSAEEEEQRKGGMKEGLAYVRSDAPTLAMIALFALSTISVFPVMAVLLPLYARDTLGLPATGMGALMSASAIGSLSGSIGLLGIRREQRRKAMILVAATASAAVATMAQAHHALVATGALMVVTVSFSTMMGLGNITIQERTPAHMRGRVSAIAGLSFFGLMPFASLGITAIADAIGMRTALTLAAAIFGVGAAFVHFGPGRKAMEPCATAEMPTTAEVV